MHLSIFRRLALGYAVLMLFVIFMGAYVKVTLGRILDINREVRQVDGAVIRGAERLQESLFSLMGFENKYVITGDPDFRGEFVKVAGIFREELKNMSGLGLSGESLSLLKGVEGAFDRFGTIPEESERTVEGPEKREILAYGIHDELKKLVAHASSERDIKVASADRIASQVVQVITGAALLTLVVGVLISFFITRSIVRPISLLKGKTREISRGKFLRIPSNPSPPEIRDLADDFNLMSEKLEEMDNLKKEFISHVSHELRTPLTSIKAASSMLSEGAFKASPEKEQELFTIIKDECERLIGTVNRILDLSRMEAKMMDYRFTQADLPGVVRLAVLKLAPLAQKRKIDIEVKPSAGPARVRMDPDRIFQVVENILGNALKFTPERGRITLETSVDEGDGGGGFAKVSISDTGIGIPPESLEQIFERFKRVDTGRGRGTGLGLSIARHIVEDHGGKIWALSTPGKGSTFCFTLPLS